MLIGASVLAATIVLGVLGAATQEAKTTSLLDQMQSRSIDVAESIRPCVVSISCFERTDDLAVEEPPTTGAWHIGAGDDRFPGFKRFSALSGFVYDAENQIILTARSPLLKADGTFADVIDIETASDVHAIAVVVGAEPTLDLALLKLVLPLGGKTPRLEQVQWGSSNAVRQGQFVFAAGDPFGIERFFAMGALCAVPQRACYQELLSASYLQASLPWAKEAAGGPLLDLQGRVIGLLAPRTLSASFAPAQGDVQFALPESIIRTIVPPILKNDSRRSPWLGFAVMSREELREKIGPRAMSQLERPPTGIFIENVFDPSPAHKAGIQPGDFLVRFNSQPINTPLDFQKHLYLAGIGAEITLQFYRKGTIVTKEFKIAERPAEGTTTN